MNRQAILKTVAACLHCSGVNRLIGLRYRGLGCIFMLHNVARDRGAFLNDWEVLQLDYLDRVLRYLRSTKCDIISINDVPGRLKEPAHRPFAVFTFDDGYRDNRSLALPLFEHYQAPMTIYVTTEIIQRRAPYWWGALRELIKSRDKVAIEALGGSFSTGTSAEKERVYRLLVGRVQADRSRLVAPVEEAVRAQGLCSEAILEREALSENDLRLLGNHALVTIGGHTTSHPTLSALSEDEARTEMWENKRYLENLCQKTVDHFAFPYGTASACGEREFRLARELGFTTATTSRKGGLFPQHAGRLHSLPRLPIVGHYGSVAYLEMLRQGTMRAVETGFGDPAVVS